MTTRQFKAGETIIIEGESGDSAYLVLTGSVQISVGQDKKKKNVAELRKGEVFGEMSLIDPGPRSATVLAIEDTECLITSYSEFMDLVQDHPERAIVYMQTLVKRLRQMNDMVTKMSPSKKSLVGIIRDWSESMDQSEVYESEDEKRLRLEYMMQWTPMF
ncbi:MAG: CRP/FNR family cyclic AMP-dependent transcriptional regulator [Gammaproteobacteria bacterium]|jgi:CRP/FNR family cyclic AMP-dependent transcriptional regulator